MISAGKTFLRCRSHPLFSLSLCFLYIPPFLTLHSPLSVHRATPAMCPLFLSPSFLSPRSLPPASLFHPTNLHLAPTNMAVFGFVGKGVGACGRMGWGPRLSPWRSTSKHSNEGGVRARSHVSSRIVTVRAGGESDGNTGAESWLGQRPPQLMTMTSPEAWHGVVLL